MKSTGTLYQILKIRSTSSFEEVEAAYKRLSEQLRQPGAYGLDKEDAQARLKLIEDAHWTLADPTRRAHYDAAMLAEEQAAVASGPTRMLDPEKIGPVIRQAPRVLNIVNGTLKAVLLVVLIGFLVAILYRSSWNSNNQRAAELAQAERIRAQEQALEYGGKSPSEIEAAKQAEEQREQERAQRNAERIAAKQLEADRRYAARVTEDLQRADERIRRENEYADRQREREEQRRRQEEEYRAEQQKRRWQAVLSR